MRDLTKILRRSNLTAKERALLLIRNSIRTKQNQKGTLSEADVEALRHAPNESRADIATFNKYIDAWNHFRNLSIDMQMVYLNTRLKLSQLDTLVLTYTDQLEALKRTSVLQEESSREFLLAHTGIAYDHLLYTYTFHSLPQAVQTDILSLDPEMPHDHSYWQQEVQLAEVLTDKAEVTEEEINALTDIIINRLPWSHTLDPGMFKISVRQCVFNLHFGSYPMEQFAVQLADRYNVSHESLEELKDTLAKRPNLKHELTTVVREAIASGLFITEYIPLCNSHGTNTHNGDTSLPHKETMKAWCKAMKKADTMLQKHIDLGELELATSTARFFEAPFGTTYVTGRSLMHANPALPFVSTYRAQVDSLVTETTLFEIFSNTPIFTNYSQLLTYAEIAKKMDVLISEDVSACATEWIKEIKESVYTLYMQARRIRERMDERLQEHRSGYRAQTFFDDLTITLEETRPATDESIDMFEEDMKKLLGWEWSSLDVNK